MPIQDAPRNQSNRPQDPVHGVPPSKQDLTVLMQRAEQTSPQPLKVRWQRSEDEPQFVLMVGYNEGADGEPSWQLSSVSKDGPSVIWNIKTENPDEVYKLLLKSITSPPDARKTQPEKPQSSLGLSPANDANAYRMLQPSEQFAGRYRVLRQIGHGGMGRIYQVVDIPNNRIIALKVLHPHLLDDEEAIKRFEREAKASMHLRHPNLLRVFDYGFSEDRLPFIAMEYLDGEVLQQLLKIDGPLEVRRFLTIFLQTCSALYHAHTNSVIHRDVKPGNIMLIKVAGSSDLAKLVDFGIAKILKPEEKTAQKLTQTGDVFGSPFYMSPEQCMGIELDARSDIYSLGCVMYEAISGRRVFEGMNALATMQMQVSNRPKSFEEVNPMIAVPPQIESVIFRTLEKRPEDRFQSAKELGKELERLLSVDQINLDNEWISNQTRSGTFYTQLPSKGVQERTDLSKVVDLLKECDMINGNDHREAMQLLNTSGAEVTRFLTRTQLSEKTIHAAVQCQKVLERGECKIEMAVIALHYCHKNGVTLREAFDQLGWRLAPGTE